MFGKQRKNNSNKSKNRNKGWFNKECYEARKKFNVSRNIFTRNKNEINKQAYLSDKREYTKIKRNSKRAFKTIYGKRVANLANTKLKTPSFLKIILKVQVRTRLQRKYSCITRK